MKFEPKNVADFLKHPLFLKWITTSNTDLEKYWKDWCIERPEKVVLFRQAEQTLRSIQWKQNHHMEYDDKERILNNIIQFNRSWESKVDSRKRVYTGVKQILRWGTSVAAVFILIGFLLVNVFDLQLFEASQEQEIEWIVKNVPRGVKKTFMLPDGSKVTLNSASEIKYPSIFEISREVELSGQAFFEVMENPKMPFVVTTNGIKTTVLGTSFDVNAYPNQSYHKVSVVTGKVGVETPSQISAILTKEEATLYHSETGSLQRTAYDYDLLVGWKEKKLKFQNEDYDSVFQRLSNWFDVEFNIKAGDYPASKYTGYFFDQSLEYILEGMKHTSGLEYSIEGKKVSLKFP
ncbi:FecR family protein [Belliella sp. DSM 111904]|uniref:FecR family protein n=1 Tax=Belliella filtrata TaxID=2923435 RepID=A0ABS9V054_9BACT|nr:FecR family protein [Belliella filtrata]MCH7409784.1 FecR family protein [Belliella filtrata]